MKYTLYIIYALVLCCGCQKSWEERCEKEAKHITETTCPRYLSPELMMDSLTYDAALNRYIYHYRAVGQLDNEQTFTQQREQFLLELRNSYDNSVEMKPYKDHGMSFQCIYRSDSTHKILLDFVYEAKK